MLGEEHGNAAIADFAAAYWRDLNGAGFNYAAIETDPWAAAALERELRAGGIEAWTRFAAARGGAAAAPFVTWAPEARLAQTIVETSDAERRPAIWGIDQVFLGSAAWILADVASGAHDRQARALAATLAESGAGKLDWFTAVEEQALIDLRARLGGRQDRRFAQAVDAMIVSRRIYLPFTGGGGEAWIANTQRETLMKMNFLEQVRLAERADGEPPRVMLKFGAYHMYRGPTPTQVQGLGGFVTEYATLNGRETLNVYIACGPGGRTGNFESSESCDEAFARDYGFLAPFVSRDEITVFDLRVWKLRSRRWAHLPADVRDLISAFDVLVVVPNGASSAFLPGLALPARPGG